MATIYEVAVHAGTYMKDGQEKTRYQTIGRVVESPKGPLLKIDHIPLVKGGWEGWAYLFTPRKDDAKPVQAAKQPAKGFENMDDDIPF